MAKIIDRDACAKFLVVEDNRADFLLLHRAFRRITQSADLLHVESAEDALSVLRNPNENSAIYRPDLILLDLNLPYMSGHEFLSIIKRDDDLCCIPVFILSSSTAESDIRRGYANHANGYIAKPMACGQYDVIADTLLRLWFGMMELPPAPQEPDIRRCA